MYEFSLPAQPVIRNRGKEEKRGGLLARLTNRRQLFAGLLASITGAAAELRAILEGGQ